ncbi:hypothetical protein DV736_g4438, partial [Chaetothyriales sp. CBS 134916]
MATEWVAPPSGTPCWINLFATDVSRAQRFYEDAFGWKFRDLTKPHHGTSKDPNEIALFEFGSRSPGGGITRVDQVVSTKGKGGAVLYLIVDDIDAAMKKVIAAGGKQMTEVEPEGKGAVMQHFEDTEGNYGGLYQLKHE